MKIQDEMIVPYSKLNPYLLSEVVNLILTKPSTKKFLANQDNLKLTTSNDFMNIFLYLALQDIPKVQLNIINSKEIKCKHILFKNKMFNEFIIRY